MFEGGISGEFTSVHELAKKMNSGQLKICSRIGEGMYSKVYGATIDKTHKVAIKWMDCENLRSEIRDKFLPREINNWKKICHPNLLRLFAIVEGISTKAMFCELTEYGDLLRILQKSGPRFPFAQKTLWIGQIVKAIDYLHSRNIAHRDLKCENCLYFPNDVIKVTDFGFCVETQRVGELSQTFCGSRAYSAPELVRGEPYDVFKVDIWALGVIIAVIVNHTMPYVDSSGVDNNAFLVHLQEQRILILNHAVPPKHLGMCQDSLDCLLRQYPAARPDSATLMFCAWWRCVTAWHGDHILLRQRIFEYLC
ncbi:hypothetical protein L596_024924 [Steinernema carpocapsae]|nr:hypothetical protein L596_024924 [Steinernema carpocapsae]